MNRYSIYSLLMLAIVLSACGSGEIIEGPLGADPTAEEVLQGAREAMAAVTSYRWTMDGVLGTGVEASSLMLEGTWGGGDRFAMSGPGDGDAGSESFEYIFFEEGVLALEDDGTWRETPYHAPPPFPRIMGRDWAEELPEFDNLSIGRTVDHARAFLLLGTHLESEEFRTEYEVIIWRETLLIHSMTGAIFAGEESAGSMTTRFNDYNEKLDVEIPETWIPFDDGF